MKKNFTLVLNIVLVIAVAVLFYFHFSSPKQVIGNNSTANTSGFKVAYFDEDSLQEHYEYYKEIRNALTKLEQQKSEELNTLRNNYVKKGKEYQEKAATMTQAEQQNAQQDMMERENDYKRSEQLKAQEMQDEQMKRGQDIRKRIEDFLKEYNKDKGYAYIFSSSQGLMYYKDTAYNITQDMIKGLNETYKKQH